MSPQKAKAKLVKKLALAKPVKSFHEITIEAYKKWIEDLCQERADREMTSGEWQNLLGEIIYDLQVKARS